ncbi:hypothetical protein AB3K78_09135 [Leucobacter sp. HNU]|uniref:hypothetical protein n=1 Tax=Leucobacter sp. HNU TaxID=3236805 RepID=UPI003A7F9DB8
MQDPEWAEALDVNLLQGELSTPLPDGGCGYAARKTGSASNSDHTYRSVNVFYFRLGEEGRITEEQIEEWGKNAGGVLHEEVDDTTDPPTSRVWDNFLDLPQSISGWSGGELSWVDGENAQMFFELEDGTRAIPEYTQLATARIKLPLDSELVATIVAQGANTTPGAVPEPTQALSKGLSATFSNSFSITDEAGYTGTVEFSGKLQPWTSDVTDAPPGQFEALSKASTQGVYTNTTPERRSKLPGMRVWALYPVKSAGCTGGSGISVEGDDWASSSYCILSLGGTSDTDLEPGAVHTPEKRTADLKLGPFDENGDALAVLNMPSSIYVAFGGSGQGSTNVDWTGDKGCLVHTQNGAQWLVVMDGWPEVLCN